MTTSEQVNEIAAALSKAQGAMKPAEKSAENEAFKKRNGKASKYADLAANVEAARKPLADNGLSYVQEPTTTERGIAVATRLMHSSGQWIQFDPLVVPLSKQDAHGVGSASTYARRYALGAALGLVAEDDDGNAAVESQDQAYTEWLADLEAVADEGSDKLLATVKASDESRRNRLRADTKSWGALKARAEKADKSVAA